MSLSELKIPGMWPSDEPISQFDADTVDFEFFIHEDAYAPEPEEKYKEPMPIPPPKPKFSDNAASANLHNASLEDVKYQPLRQQVHGSPVKSFTDLNNVDPPGFSNAYSQSRFADSSSYFNFLQDHDHHESRSYLLANGEQYAGQDAEHVQTAFRVDLNETESNFGNLASAGDTLQKDDHDGDYYSLVQYGEHYVAGNDDYVPVTFDQDYVETEGFVEDPGSPEDFPTAIFTEYDGSSSDSDEADEVSSVVSYDEDATVPTLETEPDDEDSSFEGDEADEVSSVVSYDEDATVPTLETEPDDEDSSFEGDEADEVSSVVSYDEDATVPIPETESSPAVSVLSGFPSEDVIPSVEVTDFDVEDRDQYDSPIRPRSSSPEEPVERKTYSDKSVHWSSEQGRDKYGIHWRRYLSPSKSETPEIEDEEDFVDETTFPSDDGGDSSYEEEPSSDEELDPEECATESSLKVEELVNPTKASSQPVPQAQYASKYPRKAPWQTSQNTPSGQFSDQSLPAVKNYPRKSPPQSSQNILHSKFSRKGPYQHSSSRSSRKSPARGANDFVSCIGEGVKVRNRPVVNYTNTTTTKKRSRDDEDLDDDGYQSSTPPPKKVKQTVAELSIKKTSPIEKANPSKKRAREVEDDDSDADLDAPKPKKIKKDGHCHSQNMSKKASGFVNGRPPIRPLPERPEIKPTLSAASGKPKKSGWELREVYALYYSLVELRNEENINNTPPLKDAKLFNHMSEKLRQYNIHRPGSGCKATWNRYGRDKYKYEERVYVGPQLPWVSCNQAGKKDKKNEES